MTKPIKMIELSESQKEYCLQNYENMTLPELTERIFGIGDIRSIECKSIRAFLAGAGKEISIKSEGLPITYLELNKEQKQKCDELIKNKRTDNSVELARLIFANPNVKSLSHEWRAVFNYVKEIYPDQLDASEEPVDQKIFQIPDRIQNLVGMVNRFVATGDNRKAYNWNNLKSSEERQLKSLMKYMRNFRFHIVASSYDKRVDRELFVSTFIRWAHDKPDLTEIEVDQMISAAEETVNILQISRSISRMDKLHGEILDGDVLDENGRVKKFGMTEVEQINAVRTKHDQAKKNLQSLMEKLETARSKRIDAAKDRNASFINLVDEWMKDEQKRMDIIAEGKREKEEDKREIGRLKNMDEIVALVMGQTEEEAAN